MLHVSVDPAPAQTQVAFIYSPSFCYFCALVMCANKSQCCSFVFTSGPFSLGDCVH